MEWQRACTNLAIILLVFPILWGQSAVIPSEEDVHPILRHADVCGIPQISKRTRQGRIVNGTEARPHSWPWQASLTAKVPGFTPFYFLCGASVISRQWILSAAHCFYDEYCLKMVVPWTVSTGEHVMHQNKHLVQNIPVSHIIIHEDFVCGEKKHDIALLKLKEPLNFNDYVHPICLPRAGHDFAPGQPCVVAGWPEFPYVEGAKMQEVTLPIISPETCNQDDYHGSNVTEKMLCAGTEEGGRDSCSGDSGSPLMCQEDGRWLAAGILSWGGRPCGNPKKPGVYTKTSEFIPWIFDRISQINSHISDRDEVIYIH